MIYLFSKQDDGALFEGAQFMSVKNRNLTQVCPTFYKSEQQAPFHGLMAGLDQTSRFETGSCVLNEGEAAIIVAHGDGPRMISEEGKDVTVVVIALLERLLCDNPNKYFSVFIAACGGARIQTGERNSLLGELAGNTQGMYEAMLGNRISFYGYNAEAGLVIFEPGWVNENYVGTHIYGLVRKTNSGQVVPMLVGYDTHVCTQLHAIADPNPYRFATIIFAPGIVPLQEIIAWSENPRKEPLQVAYPGLFETMSPNL